MRAQVMEAVRNPLPGGAATSGSAGATRLFHEFDYHPEQYNREDMLAEQERLDNHQKREKVRLRRVAMHLNPTETRLNSSRKSSAKSFHQGWSACSHKLSTTVSYSDTTLLNFAFTGARRQGLGRVRGQPQSQV
jgi:hypothetical protein